MMRIIQCSKGGKVPEGYCRDSCLNFSAQKAPDTDSTIKKLGKIIGGKRKPLIQFDKENICSSGKLET